MVKQDDIKKEISFFFEMQECRADKNWTYFLENKGFQKMSAVKVVLLIQFSYKKIICRKFKSIFDTIKIRKSDLAISISSPNSSMK